VLLVTRSYTSEELELELIHTQMTQKPMLRAEGDWAYVAQMARAKIRGRGWPSPSQSICSNLFGAGDGLKASLDVLLTKKAVDQQLCGGSPRVGVQNLAVLLSGGARIFARRRHGRECRPRVIGQLYSGGNLGGHGAS
jgi:hypothetical protein